jgi:hypothetical protein
MQSEVASLGKPGDDAKGGFLGGARSPRPRGKAGPEPRHNIIIEGKGTPGGPMGRSPGESEVSLAGVRSPPLRGGQAQHGWPCGANPEIARKAVFSEGRTLCVRIERLGINRDISFPPHPLTMAR